MAPSIFWDNSMSNICSSPLSALSLLLLLLYAASLQRDPTICAWSRSRFLPVNGRFFLATVSCLAVRLWVSVESLETNLIVTYGI